MIKNFEIEIFLRFLKWKSNEFFVRITNALAVIGIALGVATLIVVMSVMNGYERELITRILGLNGHLSISNYEKKLENYDDILKRLSTIDSIVFKAPVILSNSITMNNSDVHPLFVRAMNFSDISEKPILKKSLKYGSFPKEQDEILIGIDLAKSLNVWIGGSIKIISPNIDNSIVGAIPKFKTFKISGLFETGMHEYDSSTVFMPILIAKKLFGFGNAVSEIEIITNNVLYIQKIKHNISETLKTDPDLYIGDFTSYNQSLSNALRVERNVMFVILTMIVLIAVFNIISGLIMIVKDKKRSIAVLRSIGATRGSIIKIFIMAGTFIGVIGTVSGCFLGVLIATNVDNIRIFLESFIDVRLFEPTIYFLKNLPVFLNMEVVLGISLMSIFLSFLASIYPASRAAKLSPARVLRYE